MLKQMEEHSLIVRALLLDETANTSTAINTFIGLGLYKKDANGRPTTLNRNIVLQHLKRDGGATLRGQYGMGRGAWTLLMRMMLESA